MNTKNDSPLNAGVIPNRPCADGERLGVQLAKFASVELEKAKAKYPNHKEPCKTCAFRLGTVPNRCASTGMDALKCVMERTEFHCHEEDRPCVGWWLLANGPPIVAPWPFTGREKPNPDDLDTAEVIDSEEEDLDRAIEIQRDWIEKHLAWLRINPFPHGRYSSERDVFKQLIKT